MTIAQIYLSESLDNKVNKLSRDWSISKHDTIIRILEKFVKEEN